MLLTERHRRGDGVREFERQIRGLLSDLLWWFSEADGKYAGCRYWSVGAIESRRAHGRIETSRRKVGGQALRHEHLFPRAQLIDLLLALDPPDVDTVGAELHRLNIGVVVTVTEHDRLPDDGEPNDPWARYRQGSVEWVDTSEPAPHQ